MSQRGSGNFGMLASLIHTRVTNSIDSLIDLEILVPSRAGHNSYKYSRKTTNKYHKLEHIF